MGFWPALNTHLRQMTIVKVHKAAGEHLPPMEALGLKMDAERQLGGTCGCVCVCVWGECVYVCDA